MSNNRTKILNMHTKKFIDNMYTDVFYNKPCKVPLVKLTAEDIQNTKLDVLKNEFKGNKRSKADIKYQDNNTSAEVVSSNKRLKLCEDKIDDIKLILSKEGEVNKPPEKVKTLQNASTSKDDAKLMGHKNSKANTKSKENITSTADKISKEDTKFKGNTNSKLDVKSQDKITTKDDNFSKTGQKSQDNDTHTEEESANNKLNLSTDEADLVELVLSRKSEPDTSIKEGKTLENDKTSNDDTMFNGNTNSKFDIKSQDKVTTKDDNISKTGIKSQNNNTHAEEESTNNKPNMSRDEIDVELVLSLNSKPDTSRKEGKTLENDKTSNDDTMFNGNTNSKFDIKSQDKMTNKDDNISKTGIKSQNNNTHAEEESTNNKPNMSRDEIDVELVLSLKSKPDTSRKEGKTLEDDKTSNDDTMFNGNTNSKFDIKSQDNDTRAEEEFIKYNRSFSKKEKNIIKLLSYWKRNKLDTSRSEGKTIENDKTYNDDTMFNGNTNSKFYVKSEHKITTKDDNISKTVIKYQDNDTLAKEESANKKLNLYKDKIDIVKLASCSESEKTFTLKKDTIFKDYSMYKGKKISKTSIKSQHHNTLVEEPPNKKIELCKNIIDVSKLLLSRECEPDTSKTEGETLQNDKTLKDDTMFKGNTNSKVDIKTQDKTTFKDNKMSIKSQINNTHAEEESPKKKLKLCIDKFDVVILPNNSETRHFKSQSMSSIRPLTEIASTSTKNEPMVTDCVATAKSKNSSDINVRHWLHVVKPAKMMTKHNLIRWNKMEDIFKLSAIEKIYVKYFNKSIQDTIVIITNILNIIIISDKYHETRSNASFKKKTAAERLKESCDADQLHEKHTKILETELKGYFAYGVSIFAESEFDLAFKMFFLCILSVLRVLDQSSFKLGSVFKKLATLLWNSLKNSNYKHTKIFSMLRSKTFKPDCVKIITVIEDSRVDDPGVVDRMELFFISSAISLKYFQDVIDAVTGNLNNDLSKLIDDATRLFRIHSKYKDPVNSSTVQQPNDKIPVTKTIQTPPNTVETIQNWLIANNPNITYRQMPVPSVGQTIVNAAVELPIVARVVPMISNNSMMQFTTSSLKAVTLTPSTGLKEAFKPPLSIKKSMPNNLIQNAVGATVGIDNKLYQLIKDPSGALRAFVNNAQLPAIANNTQLPAVANNTTTESKCDTRHCNNEAILMCSVCNIAKYCCINCQNVDWYCNHKNECLQK